MTPLIICVLCGQRLKLRVLITLSRSYLQSFSVTMGSGKNNSQNKSDSSKLHLVFLRTLSLEFVHPNRILMWLFITFSDTFWNRAGNHISIFFCFLMPLNRA